MGALLLSAEVVEWLRGFPTEIALIVLPTIGLVFAASVMVFVFLAMRDAHPA